MHKLAVIIRAHICLLVDSLCSFIFGEKFLLSLYNTLIEEVNEAALPLVDVVDTLNTFLVLDI